LQEFNKLKFQQKKTFAVFLLDLIYKFIRKNVHGLFSIKNKGFCFQFIYQLFKKETYIDSGSGGRISWDRNSLLNEVEIQFVHEVKFVH
jgi:hypothetical protein